MIVWTQLNDMCLAAPEASFAKTGAGAFLASKRRTVSAEEIAATLQDSFATLLGGDAASAHRLASVEASIWQTYQALPKNTFGRLAPRAVRHIVHSYFAREHGWLIKGLEPHGMRFHEAEMHDVNILQDKAPGFVESLLEARQSDRGLALEDVAVMVVALERLIFDESLALLNASYALNGISLNSDMDESSLHEVLTSYLMVFGQGAGSDSSDAERHRGIKEYLATASNSGWSDLVQFERDAAFNYDYGRRHRLNPFISRHYSFHDASEIIEEMTRDYGKWQDAECRQMKSALLDLAPDGSGRVPLGVFYSQPSSALYQFTESGEYLKDIGALDESKPGAPAVRIANYLLGPSNCIASSSYYSICCLSECEVLVNELEVQIKSPESSPERLQQLVGNLSSATIEAPRELPQVLTEKLHGIASRHGGTVPLHGRLFMQWLHHAFPNECPYPAIVEKASALTQGHWEEQRPIASEEEKSRHMEAVKGVDFTAHVSDLHWSDDEVLPVHDLPGIRSGFYSKFLRPIVQVTVLVFILRAALTAWKAAAGAKRRDGKVKDVDLCEIPSYC